MIVVTQEQLEEQIALEREAIAQGLKRLRDNTMKLEQKDYASASIYGVASIDTLLPLVVERIQATVDYREEGKVGASFKEIQQYLANMRLRRFSLSTFFALPQCDINFFALISPIPLTRCNAKTYNNSSSSIFNNLRFNI